MKNQNKAKKKLIQNWSCTLKNNLLYSINEYNLLIKNKIDTNKFMVSKDCCKKNI